MDLSVLALSIVKQGEADIPGVTDVVNPKRLGPKRATKIRKMFGLTKDDDVSPLLPPKDRSNLSDTGTLFPWINQLWMKQCSDDTTANAVYRSANSLSAVKSSQRRRARSHTPKPHVSSVSLHPNVYNTSVTCRHSSAADMRHRRRQLYVTIPTRPFSSVYWTITSPGKVLIGLAPEMNNVELR